MSALAVLKSGAAYLPLDPSTPADRAAFILNDAGAPILLTHRRKASGIPSGPWRVIELDGASAESFAGRAAAGRGAELAPDGFDKLAADSLAYVIYTSGSSGQPKGVDLTHANLLNLVDWHIAAFGVTAADRASQVAGLGFDAAGWEIWPSLAAGASVHIADELTRRSPHALRDWLVAEKITISFVPTILAEPLLQANWPAGTALRRYSPAPTRCTAGPRRACRSSWSTTTVPPSVRWWRRLERWSPRPPTTLLRPSAAPSPTRRRSSSTSNSGRCPPASPASSASRALWWAAGIAIAPS